LTKKFLSTLFRELGGAMAEPLDKGGYVVAGLGQAEGRGGGAAALM